MDQAKVAKINNLKKVRNSEITLNKMKTKNIKIFSFKPNLTLKLKRDCMISEI